MTDFIWYLIGCAGCSALLGVLFAFRRIGGDFDGLVLSFCVGIPVMFFVPDQVLGIILVVSLAVALVSFVIVRFVIVNNMLKRNVDSGGGKIAD
ncbi:hypothetical protein ACFL0K_00810 [Patescibacteria group bacterium]